MSTPVLIRIKPREAAEISERNNRHPAKTQAKLQWNSDRTVDMVDPPDWALQVIKELRAGGAALVVDCPTCHVKAGTWCLLAGRPRENRIHDKRRFQAWEAEHGKPIHGK